MSYKLINPVFGNSAKHCLQKILLASLMNSKAKQKQFLFLLKLRHGSLQIGQPFGGLPLCIGCQKIGE